MGTISWIANYLWLPSEYTIAIIFDIDRHRAATAIIFHTLTVAKMFMKTMQNHAVGTVMAVEDNSIAYPAMPLPATPLY